MIYKELEKIVAEGKQKGLLSAYIVNLLKEYLQIYVLTYVYTSPLYAKNFIFTGGTCLRHFFGLERLSVDLDFDLLKKVDVELFANNIRSLFEKKYRYNDATIALKSNDTQLRLKFPVLKKLGLAAQHESEILRVKVDLSDVPSQNYNIETSSKTKFGLNFVARHYDLPSLMAGKLHAILTRRCLRGKENRLSVKGRDYFDLLWFVKNGVKPNIVRLSDMLGERITTSIIEARLGEKVADFVKKHSGDFESDMVPLIENPDIIKSYISNYKDEYLRNKALSFSQTFRLEVKCGKCEKLFSSGIVLSKDVFDGMEILSNKHYCPFCGHANKVEKKDYVVM